LKRRLTASVRSLLEDGTEGQDDFSEKIVEDGKGTLVGG
jgi:hypothetical protein